MNRRHTLDEWRRGVYRCPRLSDRARVVLLYLADHMRQDRRVSVPRKDMIRDLDKPPRRLAESIAEAHRIGWLATVSRGQKGRTAVYEGLFPNPAQGAHVPHPDKEFSMSSTSTLRSAETRTLTAASGCARPAPQYYSGAAATTADRDGQATPCPCHGFFACDYADHEQPRDGRLA